MKMTDPHIAEKVRCLAARSTPEDLALLQDVAELLEYPEDQNIKLLDECQQLKDGYTANRAENLRIVNELRNELINIDAEFTKLKELYDNACDKLRLPGTDNDGGPGDIAEDVECMIHNSNAAWEMVATCEKELARANAIIDCLLGRCIELEKQHNETIV